ncbi:MAG: hypothetical protein IJK23_01065 [Clostridia bacterium]|nr:hypothetical protein [Clostridia bacterium]
MLDKNAAERLALKYNAALTRKDGGLIFTNRENGKTITVLEDPVRGADGKELSAEYIAEVAAQHRHYEDFEDALDYVEQLMRDEILAIEYYAGAEPRFGGDIERSELNDPNPPTRGTIFSMLPADHPGLNYEIISWSGKYDLKYEKY